MDKALIEKRVRIVKRYAKRLKNSLALGYLDEMLDNHFRLALNRMTNKHDDTVVRFLARHYTAKEMKSQIRRMHKLLHPVPVKYDTNVANFVSKKSKGKDRSIKHDKKAKTKARKNRA